MSKGFIITKLVLQGLNVEQALIVFKQGLNVITGPTDTGKTFVYECLDFMMGGEKLNRLITEANNYEKIFLEIKAEEKFYTLERAIKGGDFNLYQSNYELINSVKGEILAHKHNANSTKTISAFFLQLNNLWDKKIRINNDGKVRTLSYRDICHLMLVSENQVTTTKSPIIHNGQTQKTAEVNVTKFIVTGKDDSSLIASLDKEVIASRKGKLELLDEIIEDFKTNITFSEIEQEIESKNKQIEQLKIEQDSLLGEFTILDKQRKVYSKELFEIYNKIESYDEILTRSSLLYQYYNTDIQRLTSTIEAGFLLHDCTDSQLCPLCNNKIEREVEENEVLNIVRSCEKEVIKIESLIEELNKSTVLLETEKKDLMEIYNSLTVDLKTVELKIENDVNLKLIKCFEKLTTLNEEKNLLYRGKIQYDNINQLNVLKETISSSITKKTNSFSNLSTALMQPISDRIQDILEACKYDNLGKVSFSDNDKTLDFVLGGKERNLSGKGKRAISYAAFVLSLAEYSLTRGYYLGVPIIDSPLVTYSKPDPDENDEGISPDIAMNFYRYCANISSCKQIIIIENSPPPSDIETKINHIIFTGIEGKGRFGFIPIPTKNSY
ncbi:AAA family ATPase [Flectobacillus major]|uniref:AAA family ATPase n=1 Tax=Flectobacillus major TaxID=103 RepID=UPI0004220A8B|nr:AAA family ATPase [Flectobacillus major]